MLENSAQDRDGFDRRSHATGPQIAGGSTKLQSSKVTNGSALLPQLDGRTSWARRYKDLVALHVADLGGPASISQAQLNLIRRAAALTVELERWECRFAVYDGASATDLLAYQRCLNSVRRTLEALGLERRVRDITGDVIARLRGRYV